MVNTRQENAWSGEFGRGYTDRNMMSPDEVDRLYVHNYGISRTALNKEFLGGVVEKNNKILEVGCNIGNQLLLLKKMDYNDLWGIELQDYAVEIARKRIDGINIVKGSAFDTPFKDNYFDVVFTSGLLIHISPDDIEKVLDEMYRCTNSYIWGFEYYTPNGYQMVNYREKNNLLWKTDFSRLFLDRFSDLELVRKRVIRYKFNNNNLDIMYLLKKDLSS